MKAAYTAKNPYSPNVADPFQTACIPMASSSPPTGTSTRRPRCHSAENAAIPNPIPVSTVNNGCANGDMITRTKNVAAVTDASPLPPLS